MALRTRELIELNRKKSAEYSSPAVTEERHWYRQKHQTEIAGTVCMDGRVSVQQYTGVPLGIFQPFRNIGGKFDLAWPIFQHTVENWHAYAKRRDRPCLFITTYHFSRGDSERGCAGFGYNTDAAREASHHLRNQFTHDFGQSSRFYTIQLGVETDLEALILHGNAGEVIDLATLTDTSETALVSMIKALFPDMAEQLVNDFLPLIQGNIQHITQIRALNRPPVEVEHRESVLAFGRGFEWFQEVNRALIVGPFDPNVKDALITAGKLILGNIKAGRITVNKERGIILLASVPYFEQTGSKPFLAARKARYLSQFAYDALQKAPELIELMPYIERITATVDQNTRLLNILAH